MTLLVEDGSLVLGAVVYVSEAELNQYADARGITIAGDESELLMSTVNYIETLNYSGTKVDPAKRLAFPRSGVVIDGYKVPVNEIPYVLKDLQCEVALYHDKNGDPLINLQRLAISEKVGELAQTFSDSGTLRTDYSPIIKTMANKLIGISSGGMSVRVSRG